MKKNDERSHLRDVSVRQIAPYHPNTMIDDTLSPWQELYIPPVGDGKGVLQGRCDATAVEQMLTLVQHPDTPFRTMSDFVRSACERLLQDVGHLLKDERLSDSLAKRRIILQALCDEEEGRAMVEMHAKTAQVIETLLKEGDIAAARRKVLFITDMARKMNDPRWRMKTLALVDKWKDLVKE